MSRALKISGLVLSGALVFGGGFAIGRMLGRTAEAEKTEIVVDARAEKFVESERLATAAESTNPLAGTGQPSSRSMAQLRALVEMNRETTRPLFSFTLLKVGQMSEDFVQAFDLTPVERQELEVIIAASKTAMAQMEAKLARIEPQADGGFTILIPTFPKEGGEAYDQFVAKLESLLGAERSGYLQEMHVIDSDRLFELGGFGLVQSNFRLLPPGEERGSSWGTQSDSATGLMKRSGYLDVRTLQFQFPFLYERMRQAGQIPGSRVP